MTGVNSTQGDLQTTTPAPKSSTTDGSANNTNFLSDYRPPSQSFNLSDTKVIVDESSSQLIPLAKETNENKTKDLPGVNVTDEFIDDKNVRQLIMTVTETVLRVSSNETAINATHPIPIVNSSSATLEEKPVVKSESKPTKELESPVKEIPSVQIKYVSANQTAESNTKDEAPFTNLTKLDKRDRNESSFGLPTTKLNSSDELNTSTVQGLKSTPLNINNTYLSNNETITMQHGGSLVLVQHINKDTIEITNQSINNDTKLAEIPPILLEPIPTPVTTINTKV